MVDQLADLFRTTYTVKTQQLVKNRGQHCGDIELTGYLTNETGPVTSLSTPSNLFTTELGVVLTLILTDI
jgi:hypothetical protein